MLLVLRLSRAVLTSLGVTLAGLGFGLSLIVVIGPQNTFLLRVGILGRGVPVVVAVCILADVALIVAGVAGAGAAIGSHDWLLAVVRYAGAAFLLGYAGSAARRVVRPPVSVTAPVAPGTGLAGVLVAALALTFLNPGVYLDTVVLLGSVATAHGHDRWWFAAGAALASALWFAALGFGAKRYGRRLDRPTTWRVLDVFVAVVMTVTAVRLLMG